MAWPIFFAHVREHDKETVLYRTLELVEFMEDDQLRLEVYKYGLTRKIKPGGRLRAKYEERRKREK